MRRGGSRRISSATRHSLGPLIRDRLVRLRVDPKDRRVKRATLTPTGVAKSELSDPKQISFGVIATLNQQIANGCNVSQWMSTVSGIRM
jgi:DNA-binding MarR family transcriptional regulator